MCSKGVQIQADTVLTSLGPILSGLADLEVFKSVINLCKIVIHQRILHSCSALAKRTLFSGKSARTLVHFIF